MTPLFEKCYYSRLFVLFERASSDAAFDSFEQFVVLVDGDRGADGWLPILHLEGESAARVYVAVGLMVVESDFPRSSYVQYRAWDVDEIESVSLRL